jgi:hypothetical protein
MVYTYVSGWSGVVVTVGKEAVVGGDTTVPADVGEAAVPVIGAVEVSGGEVTTVVVIRVVVVVGGVVVTVGGVVGVSLSFNSTILNPLNCDTARYAVLAPRGTYTVVNAFALKNASAPIDGGVARSKAIHTRAVQLWNTLFPMFITLPGIVIEVSPEQPINALFPMLVTRFGIVTEVSLVTF